MANSVGGKVIVREADGTDFTGLAARVFSLALPDLTEQDQVLDFTQEVDTFNTVSLGTINTLSLFMVKNLDTVAVLEVVFDDTVGFTSETYTLAPGGVLVVANPVSTGEMTFSRITSDVSNSRARIIAIGT